MYHWLPYPAPFINSTARTTENNEPIAATCPKNQDNCILHKSAGPVSFQLEIEQVLSNI